jgi:hypothetical protein
MVTGFFLHKTESIRATNGKKALANPAKPFVFGEGKE